MRALATSAAVVFIAVATASARADGLIHKLPEDGTWARFESVRQIFLAVFLGAMPSPAQPG